MRLAGTYHPIPYLLERLSHYLPGIVEKNALWIDFDKQLYTSHDNSPLQNHLKVKAQSVRNTAITHEWHNHSDLFTNVKSDKTQLSLEDENALHVLRIYFTSPIDQLKDVVSITFSPNVFLKSLNMTFKGISSQEKHILSSMLCSILQAEHDRVMKERDLLLQIERMNKQATNQIKQLKDNLKSTEQLYSSAIKSILESFVSEYAVELDKTFEVSQELVYKLSKERLALTDLQEIMKDAIFLAYNLNFTEQNIRITEDHVHLTSNQVKMSSPHINTQESDKVKFLLDRYEEAALKLISNHIVVNNKNLASALTPPITPPAISDAVKKNKNKIRYLLQQYPDNWTNIREGIRAIAKLDETSPNSLAM